MEEPIRGDRDETPPLPPDDSDSSIDGQGCSFTFDPGPNQPTATIIEAVAWLTGKDEMDLESIDDSVDTDALNVLFRDPEDTGDFYRSPRDRSDPGVQITFKYEGCVITVDSDHISLERQ